MTGRSVQRQTDSDILGEFKAEADERSAAIEQYVQEIRRHGSRPDLVQQLSHELHTLKGSASFLHYDDVVAGLHRAEELLHALRGAGVDSEQAALTAVEGSVASLRRCLAPAECVVPAVSASERVSPGGGDAYVRVDRQRLRELQAQSLGLDECLASLRAAIHRTEHTSCDHGQSLRLERAVKRCLHQAHGRARQIGRMVVHAQCRALGSRVPRYDQHVQQLCSETGKRIRLEVHGLGVEVHESLLLPLDSIISHLLRNSATHGVEAPDVRVRQGKNEVGLIRLWLARQGCRLELHFRDDGQGIDITLVCRQAIAMGVVTQSEVDGMTAGARAALAFEPGLSTSGTATNLVGRGLGLSAVRSEATMRGGLAELIPSDCSTSGFGIRVTMLEPMAVDRCLFCRSGRFVFALSAGHVRVGAPDSVPGAHGAGASVFRLDFECDGSSTSGPHLVPAAFGDASTGRPVRVVTVTDWSRSRTVALAVDAVIGSREVVVTSEVNCGLIPADWICGYARFGPGRLCPVINTGMLSAVSHERE